ncbi:Heparanase-like protein 3 [Dendrobium catenatum]|uniref:Heparanase-like protein 3 n=1 Tax=Dendrobium catenatum TaxID=906689 RepID=A0A2I0VIZ2_9ASPA|nr:Heparanase-like protein 3 [Dendrobium catenatum]
MAGVLYLLAILLTCSTAAAGEVTQGKAVVDGGATIASTDEHFVCATLDWWPSDQCNYGSCSWGDASILNLVRLLPLYYSALLWHRLMGPKVLATDFIGTKKIRAYTHCARDSNGITLLLLNLDLIETAYVQETREEYHLTAKDGDLHSQTVLLNGKALNVDSYGQIPALEPLEVDGSQPIKVDPVSVVFAHLPYVHAPACI